MAKKREPKVITDINNAIIIFKLINTKFYKNFSISNMKSSIQKQINRLSTNYTKVSLNSIIHV